MASMKNSLKEYARSKGAVIATAVGLALAPDCLPEEEAPQYENVADSLERMDKGHLLTPEELESEYEDLALSRDVYHQISTTRSQIGKVASFFLRTAPNAVKMKIRPSEKIDLDDLETMGIDKKSFSPLLDLGAFPLDRFRKGELDFSKLSAQGVQSLVIMEDRAPHFFLNYKGFQADEVVPLNRHGNASDQWTMDDFHKLVADLRGNNIQVILGFWGNTAEREKSPFVARNWETIQPIIPTSDDLNPLSFVADANGERMPFADYVIKQYQQLDKDFGFDGLFLGDGLMGFRSFLDPYGPYDFSDKQYVWTDFYRRMYEGLKKIDEDDTLWAYDCMANGPAAARKNGVALSVLSKYIDNYIFQSYGNDAWGRDYMRLPGYTVDRDAEHIASLPSDLKTKTRYSIGLGDAVEGWEGRKHWVQEKQKKIGPHAQKGTLGVWSTKIVQHLLAE